MKTIIALRGKGNSGKSTTIRILHGLLLLYGYQQNSSNLRVNGGDFTAIFSKNGRLIGITSSGDTYDLVHNHLQELVNANCEICVCACRTFDRVPPGTNSAIIEFTNYRNHFVEKTFDNNETTQDHTNMDNARTLLSLINSMI